MRGQHSGLGQRHRRSQLCAGQCAGHGRARQGPGRLELGPLQQSQGRPGAGAGHGGIRHGQARGHPAHVGASGGGRRGRDPAVPLQEHLGGPQGPEGHADDQRPHRRADGQQGGRTVTRAAARRADCRRGGSRILMEPCMTRPTLRITPADDLIDVARLIRVDGLAPGQSVEIATRTLRDGIAWTSSAHYRADAAGSIDLSRDAPASGSYQDVSPMGLIWAQVPEDGASRTYFHSAVVEPLRTQVNVRAPGVALEGELLQRLAADGVTRREIRDDGLVGVLYTPAGPGPHPAVMILNGSGGGINEPRAALYASRGYAALALAYFKAPGLSDYISNT